MAAEESNHTATAIASDADIETLDSYQDRIHHYENLNYTYIPMPKDGKYYNTHEGWTRDISNSQYVSPETHLLEVLEVLRQHPFILIDEDHNKFVIVRESTEDPLFVKSARSLSDRMNPEDFKDSLDFSQFEFTPDDIRVYAIDDFLASDLRLPEEQQALITPYEERFQIITLADVNSRRMKDMLYQRLAELVARLGKKIENEYPQSESIFQYVRAESIGRWKKDQIKGLNLHIAEHLNLIDMMKVIQTSDKDFVESCGFESKNDVQSLAQIKDVRNAVMHANRSLIHDRQDIADVLEAVEAAERIVENMA